MSPAGRPSDNPRGGAGVPSLVSACPPVSWTRRTRRAPPRGGKTPEAHAAAWGPAWAPPARTPQAGGGATFPRRVTCFPGPGRSGRRGRRGPRWGEPPGPPGRLTVSAENFCAGAGGNSPASRGSQQSCGSSMVTRAARRLGAGRSGRSRSSPRAPGAGLQQLPCARSGPPRPVRLRRLLSNNSRTSRNLLLLARSLPLLLQPHPRAAAAPARLSSAARSGRGPPWARVCRSGRWRGATGAAPPVSAACVPASLRARTHRHVHKHACAPC